MGFWQRNESIRFAQSAARIGLVEYSCGFRARGFEAFTALCQDNSALNEIELLLCGPPAHAPLAKPPCGSGNSSGARPSEVKVESASDVADVWGRVGFSFKPSKRSFHDDGMPSCWRKQTQQNFGSSPENLKP